MGNLEKMLDGYVKTKAGDSKLNKFKKTLNPKTFIVSASIGQGRYEFVKKNRLSITTILNDAIDKLRGVDE